MKITQLLNAISLLNNRKVKTITVDKSNPLLITEKTRDFSDLLEYKLVDYLPSEIISEQYNQFQIDDNFESLAVSYYTSEFAKFTPWFFEDKNIFSKWENGYVVSGNKLYSVSNQHLTIEEIEVDKDINFSLPYRIFKILETLKIKEFKVYHDSENCFTYIYADRLKIRFKPDELSVEIVEKIKQIFSTIEKSSKVEKLELSKKIPKKDIDELKKYLNKSILTIHKENDWYRIYRDDNPTDYVIKNIMSNVKTIAMDIRYFRIISGYLDLYLDCMLDIRHNCNYNNYQGTYDNEKIKFFFSGIRIRL